MFINTLQANQYRKSIDNNTMLMTTIRQSFCTGWPNTCDFGADSKPLHTLLDLLSICPL